MTTKLDAKDTYRTQKRIDPLQMLVAAIEAALGLLGVVFLLLYFYTGSFAEAGRKLDAAFATLKAFMPFL